MGLPDLPSGWVSPTRDEIAARYKRDVLLLNPDAEVTSGQVDVDARGIADIVLPIHSDANLIADGINEDDATGERQDRVGGRIGLPRGKARGSIGYVAVDTGPGGATYQEGVHKLQNPQTKLRYEVAEDRARQNGEHLRVRALDTGPNTDVAPGVVLHFTNPPPGSGQFATVVEQGGGRGLSGGAGTQSDPRYQDAIRYRKQNPPAGDNDAELVALLLATPDVAVEQPFTIPGIYGPGSTGFTFTVLAPRAGASRIPTVADIQAAADWIAAQMPGDRSKFPLVMQAAPLSMAFLVSWATGGWADAVPWPATFSANAAVSSASSPTSFTVITAGGPAPVAGQTVGVWDNTNKVFRRKRIGSVSGSGPYTVTCSTANGASDTSHTPASGARLSPWSDNLLTVSGVVLAYLATLGPGECFEAADIPSISDGRRRIRQPPAPKAWPYTTTNKVTTDLASLAEVADATALDGVGDAPVVNIPPRLLELHDLSFFASA